jgi:hypothetical protein
VAHLNAEHQAEICALRDEYEGMMRQIIYAGVVSGEFAADEQRIDFHVLSLLN